MSDSDFEDADEIYGWVNAYIEEVAPGEYSIDLIDDVGMPSNGTHMGTLTFSLPATVPAGSEAEKDARVIKAATEELAYRGLIPDSDFSGGGGSFRVLAVSCDRAMEWLEAQRPPAEKRDILLAVLEGLRLGGLSVVSVQTDGDNALIDIIPELAPEQPDDTQAGGDQVSIVDWDDRDEFLRAVATERPTSVFIEPYQGSYTERIDAWGDVEHPSITDLESTWAEAAQRDQELGGFTAAFRSGGSVHRYLVRALEGQLPLGWNGWRLRQISLDGVRSLELRGVPATRRAVRGHTRPRIVTGTPVPGVATPYGTPVHAQVPEVWLPGEARSQTADRVRVLGEDHPDTGQPALNRPHARRGSVHDRPS
jgi:hypothetical protein